MTLDEQVEETSVTPITIAEIVQLREGKLVEIPSNFVDLIKPKNCEKTNAIQIYTPVTGFIRTIPTDVSNILKVWLDVEELDQNTLLVEVGNVFAKNNVKTLYSTGIQFTPQTLHQKCKYEAYINPVNIPCENSFMWELSEITGGWYGWNNILIKMRNVRGSNPPQSY
jgi:hypothetical protein